MPRVQRRPVPARREPPRAVLGTIACARHVARDVISPVCARPNNVNVNVCETCTAPCAAKRKTRCPRLEFAAHAADLKRDELTMHT
eukprot:4681206-Prymnesium_polylepis.2